MKDKISAITHSIQNPITSEALLNVISLFDEVDDANTYQQMYDVLMEVCAYFGFKVSQLKSPEALSNFFIGADSSLVLLCEQLQETYQTLTEEGIPSLAHPSLIIKSLTMNILGMAKDKLKSQSTIKALVASEDHHAVVAISASLARWALRFSCGVQNSESAISYLQVDVLITIKDHIKHLETLYTDGKLKDDSGARTHLLKMTTKLIEHIPSMTFAKEVHVKDCLDRVTKLHTRLTKFENKSTLDNPKLSSYRTVTSYRPPALNAPTELSKYANIKALIFDFDDTMYYMKKLQNGSIKNFLEAVDKKLIALFQFAHTHLPIDMVIHTARNEQVDNAEFWIQEVENGELTRVRSEDFRIPPVVSHNNLSHIFTKDKILYSNFLNCTIHPDGSVQVLSGSYNTHSKISRFERFTKESGIKPEECAVLDDSLTVWSINANNQSRGAAAGILFHHVDNDHPLKNIVTRTKMALVGIIMHSKHIDLEKRKEVAHKFSALCNEHGLSLPEAFSEFLNQDMPALSMSVQTACVFIDAPSPTIR